MSGFNERESGGFDFVGEPHPSNTSEFILFSDELKMMVHPEHRWAKLGWTEWAKINSERFIATDPRDTLAMLFLTF